MKTELIDEIVENGSLTELADEYVRFCAENEARLPNMAGFFRRLGFGARELDHLKNTYRDEYRTVMMIFEDEAINSPRPPSLVSSYMKQYFREDEAGQASSESRCGPITLVFDHDIDVDGE